MQSVTISQKAERPLSPGSTSADVWDSKHPPIKWIFIFHWCVLRVDATWYPAGPALEINDSVGHWLTPLEANCVSVE